VRVDLLFPCVVLLVGMTGCVAHNIPLIEDSSTTSTKIRFVSPPEMGGLNLYPETDCNNGALVVFDNPIDNFTRSLRGHTPKRVGMIGSPDPASWEAAEYSFKGGQTINIGVTPFPGHCLSGISFPTESESQYEVVLVSNTSTGCKFKISKLTMLNNSPHRGPVKGVAPLICKEPNHPVSLQTASLPSESEAVRAARQRLQEDIEGVKALVVAGCSEKLHISSVERPEDMAATLKCTNDQIKVIGEETLARLKAKELANNEAGQFMLNQSVSFLKANSETARVRDSAELIKIAVESRNRLLLISEPK